MGYTPNTVAPFKTSKLFFASFSRVSDEYESIAFHFGFNTKVIIRLNKIINENEFWDLKFKYCKPTNL